MTKIVQPTTKLSPKFIKVQRTAELVALGITLAIVAALYIAARYFDWWEWVSVVLIGLFVLDLVYSIWSIGIAPTLYQRYFAYNVDESYITIERGHLFYSQIVIPMAKVQTVKIEQGPLLKRHGLSTIEVGTMSTSHELPGIPTEEARALRDQIAAYAQIEEID